jgi:Uma2 family endonuclease
MSIARYKAATYADLQAVPDNLVAEIIFGELVTHPRPVLGHGAATSALGAVTSAPYQFGQGGPGGWVFVDEPEIHLGPHVLVPDIAAWRRERWLAKSSDPFITVAPDWICEGLSPSTEKYDKGPKRAIYAQHGVEYLWFVDARVPSLECFVLQNREWVLKGAFFDKETVCMPPFEALTFSLEMLWPFDAPPPAND